MSTEIEINSPKRLRHLKLVGIVALLAAAGIVTSGIASRVHKSCAALCTVKPQ